MLTWHRKSHQISLSANGAQVFPTPFGKAEMMNLNLQMPVENSSGNCLAGSFLTARLNPRNLTTGRSSSPPDWCLTPLWRDLTIAATSMKFLNGHKAVRASHSRSARRALCIVVLIHLNEIYALRIASMQAALYRLHTR